MQNGHEPKPILVVDDEKAALHLISVLLKREGYEIITADSGYAAFALLEKRYAEKGSPHVAGILCDWKMPGWDGPRLLTELRSRPAYDEIPFILMSGVASREELQTASKNKASGILMKPVDRSALYKKVQDAFDKKSA